MKIKLIIILFGISCLIFPAGLMDADAIPIGPLLKGAKEVVEHIPGIVKFKGAQTGIRNVDAVDLCSSIKWEARHQKICNEDDQVEFKKVNYEQYGFTVQTPTSWQPYDVTSTMFDPGDSSEFHQFVSIWFSNDPDIWNTDEAGFLLQMIDYGESQQKVDARTYLEAAFISGCDGTPDEFGYVCSNARVTGYEENGNKAEIKFVIKEKADVYSQFETVILKIVYVQEDRIDYWLMFGDTPSDFALYSVLYDHIGDTFAVTQSGGGCLIATAAFGSEMAPQVQFLRELRDNTVLQTQSGTSFMTGFNQFYYSFSPAVADYERENPAFKETVKLALTPLLTSLTLLQYADIDSESEMLGYGIGVIFLNIGMYFVAPAVLIMAVRKRI